MLVLYPGRIGTWSVDFFVEGKPESPEKNTRSKAKSNNRNNPHKAPEGIAPVPVLICEIRKAMDGKLEFNASHYS